MSMTSKRILEVALSYFSKYGYQGTTLEQIAKEVGIKTPSIYSHFNNKEEIFFSCLTYALDNDIQFFKKYLNRNKDKPLGEILHNLLLEYDQWVNDNAIAMFCLRMLYLPPHYFRDRLIDKTNERIIILSKLLYPVFEKSREEFAPIPIKDAVEAYLCLFDGLIIELLYTGRERFKFRLNASWIIFSNGLFNNH